MSILKNTGEKKFTNDNKKGVAWVYTPCYNRARKGVFKFSTNEYKARNYDQRLIRFPKGTIKKFRELFADDVPFNAWVVNLVTSRLLMTEEKKWSTKPPKM